MLNKLQRLGHNDLRRVPLEVLEFAHTAHHGVHVEKIGDRQPVIESKMARMMRVGVEHWNARAPHPVEMPLAEVTGCVAGLLHCAGDCAFLSMQRIAVRQHASPVMGTTGQDTRPRR